MVLYTRTTRISSIKGNYFMTSEEMEKAMAFILDQQAKAESRQAEHEAKLAEYEKQNELEKKALRDNIQSLTNAIGVLAIQADKDRAEMKVAVDQMGATATAINNAVVRQELRTDKLEDQANQDRQAMVASVSRLEEQANKDRQAMASNVDKLVNAISNVHKRVSHLEDQTS